MKSNLSNHGIRGIVYDGVALAETFEITKLEVPTLPTFSAVTQDLPQRPGGYFVSRNVETREIVMRLRLNAESMEETDIAIAWREVSRMLNKPTPRKLYLEEGKYCWAILMGETRIETIGFFGEVEFTFTCFDPYFYGKEHEVALANNTTASFEVKGSEAAFPTLELTASGTSVTVTNVITAEYVTIPNVTSGAKVMVDMAQQRAEVGGEYAPVNLLSDFFPISGNAQVRVTGASGTLSYQERYL